MQFQLAETQTSQHHEYESPMGFPETVSRVETGSITVPVQEHHFYKYRAKS